MEKWIALPMHEVGVRRLTTPKNLMESFPPSILSQRKMVWGMILGWLICLAILLMMFALGDVEAAEFTKKMYLNEVDGNVQLAMLELDQQAKNELPPDKCPKLRRKTVMFDYTIPQMPLLWVTYVCIEQTTAK